MPWQRWLRWPRRGQRKKSEYGLRYLLFRAGPPARENEKVPLIVFLHGSGERRTWWRGLNALLQHGLPALARDGKVPISKAVLIACPQTSQEKWVSDATHVLRLVDELVEKHPVDAARCYLTGISMGGSGCWKIAAAEPGRFAAIVPVSGRAYPEDGTRMTPARVYHGKKDCSDNKFVDVEQALQNGRDDANTELIADPDGEHNKQYWNSVYADPELYSWMLHQQPPDANPG